MYQSYYNTDSTNLVFDLNTGLIASGFGFTQGVDYTNYSITPAANGWTRISFSFVAKATSNQSATGQNNWGLRNGTDYAAAGDNQYIWNGGTQPSSVTLNWTASSGATSYNIYYATTPGVTTATGTKITGAASGSSVTGLTIGTPYYFVVTAVDATGESTVSSEVSATPL